MIFIKNNAIVFMFFILCFFASGCKTTTGYKVRPLSTPPLKYYISDYKTKKELYFEYQHALMTIKEWQLWYNVNSGSNYFNYNDITNKEILTNEFILNTNTVLTNTNSEIE